jgi:hypothetical protein
MTLLDKLKRRWHAFKALPAGDRFGTVHAQRADASVWVKAALIAAALVALAIGVLLSIMPGPAFVFFGLGGALLAMQSAWVARRLDRTELWLRKQWARYRHRRRNDASTPP